MRHSYSSEREMYPHVVRWLKGILLSRHRNAKVHVWDSSATKLSRIIDDHNLSEFYPSYRSFDIRVDVVGAVVRKKDADLILIECKITPITLRDLGQLLGYARVAMPRSALLLSPSYISEAMHYLLNIYKRHEVLSFGECKNIQIARWDPMKNDIDIPSLIPSGEPF